MCDRPCVAKSVNGTPEMECDGYDRKPHPVQVVYRVAGGERSSHDKWLCAACLRLWGHDHALVVPKDRVRRR